MGGFGMTRDNNTFGVSNRKPNGLTDQDGSGINQNLTEIIQGNNKGTKCIILRRGQKEGGEI